MDAPFPTDMDFGPAMQACSDRERKFVWHYLLLGGKGEGAGAEAARRAGYSDTAEAAKVRAHYLMHRERVITAMDEVGRTAFRGLLIPAIAAQRALIENKDHPDHAKAVGSTLSRLGLTERTGVDVNVTGQVTVSHTDAALADLRALLALAVPREKLVEVFGHSGLQRYERMLAVADQRAGPVIEHDPAGGGGKNVTD